MWTMARRAATYNSEDWRREARCSTVDTSVFFPTGKSGMSATQAAKRLCSDCPVRARCLEFAVTTNQEYGVWGGADEDERRALRRTWRRSDLRIA
jgi:WhiB family transcriptional regulator, redox-sensing transcriptional regulator